MNGPGQRQRTWHTAGAAPCDSPHDGWLEDPNAHKRAAAEGKGGLLLILGDCLCCLLCLHCQANPFTNGERLGRACAQAVCNICAAPPHAAACTLDAALELGYVLGSHSCVVEPSWERHSLGVKMGRPQRGVAGCPIPLVAYLHKKQVRQNHSSRKCPARFRAELAVEIRVPAQAKENTTATQPQPVLTPPCPQSLTRTLKIPLGVFEQVNWWMLN